MSTRAQLSTPVCIRPMTRRDLTAVQALHTSLLPIRLPTSFFTSTLYLPRHFAFVAEQPSSRSSSSSSSNSSAQPASANTSDIVGCMLGQVLACGTTYISTLLVAKDHQRSGVGALLCRHAPPSHLTRLHCAASNEPALRAYRALGFKQSGVDVKGYRFAQSSSQHFHSREAVILERDRPFQSPL